MQDEKIKEILIETDYINKKDLGKAEKNAKKEKVELIDYLIDQEYLSRDIIGQAIAEHYQVPFIDLDNRVLDKEKKQLIPQNIAKKIRAVIADKSEKGYLVATDNPESQNLKISLQELLGPSDFQLAYALTEDINDALDKYQEPLDEQFSNKIKDYKENAEIIVDEVIKKALSSKASDVHIEPREEDESVIRYRIDGVLQEAGHLTRKQYELVVNRLKIMADLKTDEHMLPQDGAIRYKSDNGKVDLRISIAPAISGEKIVVRILAEYIKSFSFAELGMSDKIQKYVKRAIKQPFGMILIAGPTGSGKTTSLYSMLIKINEPGANIVTIEDPVEYRIEGVNHIQVNPRIELTFARGLRSIVRQDPDIILVGEIRDVPTAEISINAALTGHLLLSTFHANNSAVAITRILDMGIEPFTFASTAELVLSQRLVRKICNNCRYSYEEEVSKIKKEFPGAEEYFSGKTAVLYKGKGCPKCNNQGYSGRIGIFEAIKMTTEMKELVMSKPSANRIWQLAQKQGSEPFFKDGIQKVEQGVTTLEELYRVAAPNNS